VLRTQIQSHRLQINSISGGASDSVKRWCPMACMCYSVESVEVRVRCAAVSASSEDEMHRRDGTRCR